MEKQQRDTANLEPLVEMLGNKDGMERQKARWALETIGKPAVSLLIKALNHSGQEQIRWEAAKALSAIVDPGSIPALVIALEDCDEDVAWLAAEALAKFRKKAWPPLLRMLIKKGAKSPLLRQAVHHVLRNQKETGYSDLLATLLKSLELNTMQAMTTEAARDILKRMKAKP